MGSIDGRGKISPTRLNISGENQPSRPEIEEMLETHALDFEKSRRMKSTEDRYCGWVTSAQLDTNDFSDRDAWDYGSASVFYFREDRKVVDASNKKRLINQRIKLWLAENGRQRAPATVKQEIKDSVDAELTASAPIRAKIVQVAIQWDEQWAVVLSQSDDVVDTIIKLLNTTFGETDIRFSRTQAEDVLGEEVEVGFGLLLLNKLWDKLDKEKALEIGDFEFSLGNNAMLSSEGGTTTIKGGIKREEIEAASTEGKRLQNLGIAFDRNENNYELTVLSDLKIKDLVRPPMVSEQDGGSVLIGMSMYDEAYQAIKAIASWAREA
jgi:hypothetical protein